MTVKASDDKLLDVQQHHVDNLLSISANTLFLRLKMMLRIACCKNNNANTKLGKHEIKTFYKKINH